MSDIKTNIVYTGVIIIYAYIIFSIIYYVVPLVFVGAYVHIVIFPGSLQRIIDIANFSELVKISKTNLFNDLKNFNKPIPDNPSELSISPTIFPGFYNILVYKLQKTNFRMWTPKNKQEQSS